MGEERKFNQVFRSVRVPAEALEIGGSVREGVKVALQRMLREFFDDAVSSSVEARALGEPDMEHVLRVSYWAEAPPRPVAPDAVLASRVLLRADVVDAHGDMFTPEALRDMVDQFQALPPRSVLVTRGFGRDVRDVLGHVGELHFEDGALRADMHLDPDATYDGPRMLRAGASARAGGTMRRTRSTDSHRVVESFDLTEVGLVVESPPEEVFDPDHESGD